LFPNPLESETIIEKRDGMNLLRIDYKESSIPDKQLTKTQEKLVTIHNHIKEAIEAYGNTGLDFIQVPFDTKRLKAIQKLIVSKRVFRPTLLLIIGIGGSNLGTLAVVKALLGMLHNELQPDIRLYCADTVDDDYVYDLVLLVEQELEKDHEVIINIISKSGATTETIANAEIFIELLKKARQKKYHEYIVVTTDYNSPLWRAAQLQKFECLEIPKYVGGRFSVLTSVGLFPLGMLGIDITQLLAGAQAITKSCTSDDINKNPAALLATILEYYHHQNITIHDMFLFSVDLKSLGMWYRQLLAESLGKESTLTNKKVVASIVPTVSVGSIDLHSVGQLTLSGTLPVFTTFVIVEKNNNTLLVPQTSCLNSLDQFVSGKSLHAIMQAIYEGTAHAYERRKLPFVTIALPEKNAWYIGQWLQCHMIAIIYLGYLLDLNPFDQPNVELYKQKTREILADE